MTVINEKSTNLTRVEKDEFETTLYIAPRTGAQGNRIDIDCIFTF